MDAIQACALVVSQQVHAEFGADCSHLVMEVVVPGDAENLRTFQVRQAKLRAHGKRMIGRCNQKQSLAKQGFYFKIAALDRQRPEQHVKRAAR